MHPFCLPAPPPFSSFAMQQKCPSGTDVELVTPHGAKHYPYLQLHEGAPGDIKKDGPDTTAMAWSFLEDKSI